MDLVVSLPNGSCTCCTPWSVFQDGLDEAILLPMVIAHKWHLPAGMTMPCCFDSGLPDY